MAKPFLSGKSRLTVALGRQRDTSQARLNRDVAPGETDGGRPDHNGDIRSGRIPLAGPNRTVRPVADLALARSYTGSVQFADTSASGGPSFGRTSEPGPFEDLDATEIFSISTPRTTMASSAVSNAKMQLAQAQARLASIAVKRWRSWI